MTASWHDDAACLGLDVSLFYGDPDPTRQTGNRAGQKEAKAICDACPVKDECLDSGLDEKFGIWGGTSERQRRRMRNERLDKREGRSRV